MKTFPTADDFAFARSLRARRAALEALETLPQAEKVYRLLFTRAMEAVEESRLNPHLGKPFHSWQVAEFWVDLAEFGVWKDEIEAMEENGVLERLGYCTEADLFRFGAFAGRSAMMDRVGRTIYARFAAHAQKARETAWKAMETPPHVPTQAEQADLDAFAACVEVNLAQEAAQ